MAGKVTRTRQHVMSGAEKEYRDAIARGEWPEGFLDDPRNEEIAERWELQAWPMEPDLEHWPRVYRMDDMGKRPEAKWLIGQVIEEGGLTAFFGPDKMGKTITLSSMLWSWAAGHDSWQGESTFEMNNPVDKDGNEVPRTVLYVLLEGSASFDKRYRAWSEFAGFTEGLPNFWVLDDTVSLFDSSLKPTEPTTWAGALKKLYAFIDKYRPAILVIDTLSRATAGMDENSSQMAVMVGCLDQLRKEFGTTTVVVHHTSLDAKNRPRGHSSLKGAASSYVRVEGDPDQSWFTLVVGPHRNAAAINNDLGPKWHGWILEKAETEDSFYVKLADSVPTVVRTETKRNQILDFLEEQSAPVRWEKIYEAVYEEEPDGELDQKKLAKRSAGLPIIKKGGYWELVRPETVRELE